MVYNGGAGWTYNSNNQLTSAPSLNGMPGATGLTWDPAGNLLTMNGMSFVYDIFNQLVTVNGSPSGPVSYIYDILGRRDSKTVNGSSTLFEYDGSALIAEKDGSGNLKHSYTWGLIGLISDALLTGGQWAASFYLDDDQGATRLTVSEPGTTSNAAAFMAYNLKFWADNPDTPPMAWRSGYRDPETDIHYTPYFGSYSPQVGSWVQAASPGTLNGSAYSFGGGNPIGSSFEEDDGPYSMPIDEDGRRIGDQDIAQGLNELASGMEQVALFGADLNPACLLHKAISGENAAGRKATGKERALAGLQIAGGVIGTVTRGSKIALWRILYKVPGQEHHVLSKGVMRALNNHPKLAGVFARNDQRFIVKAKNLLAHLGYQKWHRDIDRELVKWLQENKRATPEEFLAKLREIYSRSKMRKRFPGYSLPEAP